MPAIVLRGSSFSKEANKKIEAFVRQLFLTANYLEAHMEKEFDMKNQSKKEILSFLIKTEDAVMKHYVDAMHVKFVPTGHFDETLELISTQSILKLIHKPAQLNIC